MFYDEQGKHVCTKKERLDENGDVHKGCKIVKKGKVYERNLFTAKNKLFKQDEIDILNLGLSGIAKRYGYQNVQKFYRTYHKSHSVYAKYMEQVAEWEKTYGGDNQKQDKRSVLERLKNPPKKVTDYQQQSTVKSKDRGTRQCSSVGWAKVFIRNCGLPKRTLMLVVNSIVILYNTISKRRRDSEIIRKDYRIKKSKWNDARRTCNNM